MGSFHERMSADESLWHAVGADITALQRIVSSHFRSNCRHYTRMNDGAYARVFLFSLTNGMQVVGRVILPVRESIKTEAEVATMELVRGNQLFCCDLISMHLPFPLFLPST
jgi:hypothetical protein